MALCINIFAQIGTHISSTRLPELENSWWEPVEQVLPWQNAGCLKQLQAQGGFEVEAYVDVTQIMNNPDIDGDTFTHKIINLVDDNPTNDPYSNQNLLIYFPPGEYDLDMTLLDIYDNPITKIEIKRNNVVFKGAGAELTTLDFNYDYVKYYYQQYITGWEYDDSFRVVGNTTQSINSIGFEDFRLKNTIATITEIVSLEEDKTGGVHFAFSYSNNCWISGVQSDHTQRHHVSLFKTNNIEIRDSYFNVCEHNGGGGQGYGVCLSTDCHHNLVENNIFRHMRHAMIFGNNSEKNVLGYNYEREAVRYDFGIIPNAYIEGQICFHGHVTSSTGPAFNLAEGNIVGFIEMDDVWGANGEYNTIFRNKSYNMGIQIEHENEDVNIVDNYFKATDLDELLEGYPYIVHTGGYNYLEKNNKCRNAYETFWHDHSPIYWDDFSYYYTDKPDFIPVDQWPYHPTDSDPYGDNNDNPARARWDNGGDLTIPAGSKNITTNCYVSGNVNAPGSCIDFLRNGERVKHTWADANGNYDIVINEDEFGWFDVKYSCDGYYAFTDYDVWINAPDYSHELVLDNVYLNYVLSDYVVVSTDLNNNSTFHTIQEAVDCLSYLGSGTVIILPGVYTGEDNKNISWSPIAFTEGFHIKIHGAPTSSEECIIDCGDSGVGFIFDDLVNGQGHHQYNEHDIIENLVIQNADQGIVIANGSPVIRYNKITNCEIDPYAGSDVNGAGISCKSSAYIHDNEITNCTGNWTDANLSYTYGGGIYLQNDTDEAAVIENNLISGCAAQDGGGMYCTGSGEIILDENTITACSVILAVYDPETAYPEDGIGISCIDCNDITIKNNILRENFPFQTSTEKGAFYAYNCSDIEYLNNTVVQNPDMYGFYIYAGCTTVLKNCIVSENYVGILSHSNLSVEYCCVFNNGTPLAVNASQGEGYIAENPQIDPVTFQPIWNTTTKSLCIDAGDPNSELDADGTPADIGAVCATPHKYDIIELPSPDIDSGWKWLSFPALDDVYSTTEYDPDVAQYLLASITGLPYPAILDEVELPGGVESIICVNNIWQNFDHQFEGVNGYKFHMNEAATLEVPGFVENPNTQLTLTGGAHNWIGYFLEESQLATDAFSQIWDDLYVIQHQDWCMTKINGEWYYWQTTSEPVLEYGDMVNVRCYNTHTDFQWCNDTPGDDENPIPDSEHFFFTEDAEYIPIYVEFDPEDIPAEVGVFVDGECKGAAVVEGENAQILAYIIEGQQGNVSFEFYYNSRFVNKKLENYNCVSSQNPSQMMQQINVKDRPDAWLVSFREDSTIVAAPDKVSLRNYPNPFNPTTTIAYGLPYEDKVTLNIYNVKGQLVKQLVSGIQPEGYYEVGWSGKDDSGKTVTSGIYYYQIRACGKTLHKKMLMLK